MFIDNNSEAWNLWIDFPLYFGVKARNQTELVHSKTRQKIVFKALKGHALED